MAQLSAEHHYIPKAILKGFSWNNQTVWYFSKRSAEKGVQTRNIDSIFQKRHLNTVTTPSGERDDSLERWFAKEFDDRIGAQLEIILRYLEGREASAAKVDRAFLVQFIFNHMRRTPEIESLIDPEKIMLETAIRTLARIGSPRSVDEIYPPASRQKVIQETLARVRSRQSEIVLDHLFALKLVVAVPREKDSTFIIGSQPVARLTNDGNLSIETGDVELWAPLHSRLAIGLVRSAEEGQVLYLSKSHVRHLNQTVFAQSKSVAAESADLLQSIVKPYLKARRNLRFARA